MSENFLILVRHGNTFEAGETATMVGARTDLPLTTEGERQARAAATYIKNNFTSIAGISAGPLLRTRRFAEIIAEQTQKDFVIDERLREIDYGKWEGLSSEEISRRFGADILEKWEKHNAWPENMGWRPEPDDLQKCLKDFLAEQHKKTGCRVCVTSNGILRIIHTIVTGQLAGAVAKVKTGHVCALVPLDAGWSVVKWNEKP